MAPPSENAKRRALNDGDSIARGSSTRRLQDSGSALLPGVSSEVNGKSRGHGNLPSAVSRESRESSYEAQDSPTNLQDPAVPNQWPQSTDIGDYRDNVQSIDCDSSQSEHDASIHVRPAPAAVSLPTITQTKAAEDTVPGLSAYSASNSEATPHSANQNSASSEQESVRSHQESVSSHQESASSHQELASFDQQSIGSNPDSVRPVPGPVETSSSPSEATPSSTSQKSARPASTPPRCSASNVRATSPSTDHDSQSSDLDTHSNPESEDAAEIASIARELETLQREQTTSARTWAHPNKNPVSRIKYEEVNRPCTIEDLKLVKMHRRAIYETSKSQFYGPFTTA